MSNEHVDVALLEGEREPEDLVLMLADEGMNERRISDELSLDLNFVRSVLYGGGDAA